MEAEFNFDDPLELEMDRVQENHAFVVAATVAAELNAAVSIAKDMSIVAKNARAIALRAGEQASGFKAITNFINEMASNTIRTANTINEIAINVSRVAVARINAQNAKERFETVFDRWNDDDENIESLKPALKRASDAALHLEEEFDRAMVRLRGQLDEINQQMRAAGVIAVTSRVEASRAGEYQESLNVVAENVHRAAEGIRKHILKSKALLAGT